MIIDLRGFMILSPLGVPPSNISANGYGYLKFAERSGANLGERVQRSEPDIRLLCDPNGAPKVRSESATGQGSEATAELPAAALVVSRFAFVLLFVLLIF